MTNSLQEVSRTHVSGLDCGTIENDNRIEQTLAEEGRSNAMSMVASSVTICYGSSLASHNGNKVDDQHTTVSTVRQNYDHAAGTLVSVENCSVHSIGPARADKPTSQQKQSLGHLILIADAVHNFLGGLFVGASFVDSTKLGMSAWTAAAVHEVPQELGDFAILIHAGWSKSGALAFNFLSALTFPLGAIIACVSSKKIDVSFLIPFAAGNFLYIGATDLIPEVKHCHGMKSNAVNYAAFLLGVGLLLTVRIAVDGW
jgi:zinc transporter ZupT